MRAPACEPGLGDRFRRPAGEGLSGKDTRMGIRNYLIEGVSGTGKTSVCHELRRRGYHALNGDRDLAYKGDPGTGEPMDMSVHADGADSAEWVHGHQIWDVDRVRSVVADRRNAVSFFCGGSRNFDRFIDLFDGVFVLEIDRATLNRRLDARPEDEFGGQPNERALILRLHETKEDVPKGGIAIDATAPLDHVVDEIVKNCHQSIVRSIAIASRSQ